MRLTADCSHGVVLTYDHSIVTIRAEVTATDGKPVAVILTSTAPRYTLRIRWPDGKVGRVQIIPPAAPTGP